MHWQLALSVPQNSYSISGKGRMDIEGKNGGDNGERVKGGGRKREDKWEAKKVKKVKAEDPPSLETK